MVWDFQDIIGINSIYYGHLCFLCMFQDYLRPTFEFICNDEFWWKFIRTPCFTSISSRSLQVRALGMGLPSYHQNNKYAIIVEFRVRGPVGPQLGTKVMHLCNFLHTPSTGIGLNGKYSKYTAGWPILQPVINLYSRIDREWNRYLRSLSFMSCSILTSIPEAVLRQFNRTAWVLSDATFPSLGRESKRSVGR